MKTDERIEAVDKEKDFRVTVHQNRIRRNQVTALHLMMGFLFFMMGLFTWLVPSAIKTERFVFLNLIGLGYALFGFILLLIAVFFNRRIIQKPLPNKALRVIEAFALLPILVYALVQKWYLPFAYSLAALLAIMFAYFWERYAQKDQTIEISEKGIFIPRFFRSRVLNWQDVSRVILKHSILTIDCYDNRLFQSRVSSKWSRGSSDRFNEFSTDMIEAHKHLHRDDW